MFSITARVEGPRAQDLLPSHSRVRGRRIQEDQKAERGSVMKAVLEANPIELEAPETDEHEPAAELTVTTDADLPELVRRCRELLARPMARGCPPGHWLG